MFSSPSNHKFLSRLALTIFFFTPLLSSCDSNRTSEVEMVYPPTFPEEFSLIPSQSEDPNLQNLLSAKDIIKDISIGREDPFLPPQLKVGNSLSLPKTFEYHGQIASKDLINAFVSFENRTGIIKPGDIGGETTDLLPKGWALSSINKDTNVLVLNYNDLSLVVDLFPGDKLFPENK